MSGRPSLAIILGYFIFIFAIAAADVPPLINFQGKLTDTLGFSVEDSNYQLAFSIWDSSTAGIQKWSESQTVTVKGGLFNVLLGTVNPISDTVFNLPNSWLAVKSGSSEVMPRQRFVSVAYAMKAQKADTSKVAETIISDGLWKRDGGDNIFRDSGNVGIGTTTPLERLDVNGNIKVSTGGGMKFEAGDFDPYFKDDWGVRYHGDLTHPMQIESGALLIGFASAGGEYSAGDLLVSNNVGIGTTNPIYKLHVNGSAFAEDCYTGGVSLGNGSSFGYLRGDEFRFQTNYGYATGPVKIAVRGNFANDALDSQDALYLSFQRQDPADYDNGYPYFFDIGQFGATKFRLDKFGNVGIGTLSPLSKLDVVGQIKAHTTTDSINTIEGTSSGSFAGVAGFNTGPGPGIYASSASTALDAPGIYATNISGIGFTKGVWGTTNSAAGAGVYGSAPSGGYGVYGVEPFGGTGAAVYADGDLRVTGNATLSGLPSGSGTTVVVDGSGRLFRSSSSKRYKNDIEKLSINPNEVFLLQPVRFSWKTTGEPDIGLIAEDVAQAVPDLVIYDKEGKPDAVKYDRLALYLLEIVKTQQERINTLEKELDNLQDFKLGVLNDH